MIARSAIEDLSNRGSFQVRTPADEAMLQTTVYIDGDVMTKVAGLVVEQAAADAHFSEVARRGAAARSTVRRVVRWLGAIWLISFAVLGLAFHGSPEALLQVTAGVGLSAVAFQLGWLRSRSVWLGDGLQVATPAVVAVVEWVIGYETLSRSALAVSLANLVIAALLVYARWRVVSVVKRLGVSN